MGWLYFAYGSNLDLGWLRARVGHFAVGGAARLDGHRLAFNKRGRDGSGKANLVPDPVGNVWGAVYELSAGGWSLLDGYERGYVRLAVELELADGSEARAQTYLSSRLCAEPPFAWYKELVVAGARHHGLPESWVAWLDAVEAKPDPSCEI